eukprot:6878200-Pyramimonas_sp.AAC.1
MQHMGPGEKSMGYIAGGDDDDGGGGSLRRTRTPPRQRVSQRIARRRGSPPSGRRLARASYQWPLQARSCQRGKPLPTGHYSDGCDIFCSRHRDDSHPVDHGEGPLLPRGGQSAAESQW